MSISGPLSPQGANVSAFIQAPLVPAQQTMAQHPLFRGSLSCSSTTSITSLSAGTSVLPRVTGSGSLVRRECGCCWMPRVAFPQHRAEPSRGSPVGKHHLLYVTNLYFLGCRSHPRSPQAHSWPRRQRVERCVTVSWEDSGELNCARCRQQRCKPASEVQGPRAVPSQPRPSGRRKDSHPPPTGPTPLSSAGG